MFNVNYLLKNINFNIKKVNLSNITCEKYINAVNNFSNIPFIQFEKSNLTLIINEILKLKKKDINKITELIYNDYPQLIQLVTKNNSIENILNLAAEILENPLIMTDNSYHLLAYSKNQNICDPIWQKIIENDYCPYNIVQMMKKEGFLDKLSTEKSPVFLEKGKFSDFVRRLVCEVNINDKVKGLIALLEYNKDITPLDKEILKFVSLLTAAELSKTDAIDKAKGKLKNDFIRDLIKGNFNKNNLAVNRAKALNWKLKDYFQIICIRKKNNERFTGQHLHSVQSLTKKTFPEVKVSSSYNEIIILLIKDKIKLQNTILKKLKDYCSNYNLKLGIGRQKSKLININERYREANKSLKISKKINENKVVNFYRDLNIYDIVKEIGEEKFPNELNKLINYDDNNNSELVKTLKTYYDEGQNMNKTSKSLYIHRNTVKYRLDKISDLIDIDINNPHNRIKLELGFLKIELNN